MEERYYDLQDWIDRLDSLIDEITDKDYKQSLEITKFEMQNELEDLEEQLNEIWKKEKEYQENEYWREVI